MKKPRRDNIYNSMLVIIKLMNRISTNGTHCFPLHSCLTSTLSLLFRVRAWCTCRRSAAAIIHKCRIAPKEIINCPQEVGCLR